MALNVSLSADEKGTEMKIVGAASEKELRVMVSLLMEVQYRLTVALADKGDKGEKGFEVKGWVDKK